MTQDVVALIGRYVSRGVLIDTNLLLLYLVGRFDRQRIERFKPTAQFTAEDFELLVRLLSPFTRIRTLPHVLAEVNSLSGQLPAQVLDQFRRNFADQITRLEEGAVTSREASRRSEFSFLGLTDAAIIAETIGKYLVMTTDVRLFVALGRAQVDAINFNSLRTSLS